MIEEKKFYTLPSKDLDFYGGLYFDKELNYFTRIPAHLAKRISFGFEIVNSNTSGGRVRFSTNSKEFSISIKYNLLSYLGHMATAGVSGFTLLEEVNNDYKLIKTFYPLQSDDKGYNYTIALPQGKIKKVKNYILFFPLYNEFVHEIKLGFDKDSIVSHGNKYKFDLPILYYGSSITQGACASRPDNCYPALISKWHNVDYINLGFAGGAKGEPFIVDHLTTIPSKVFVLDYDYNAQSPKLLRETHFKVYKAYRDKYPLTPIIMMSRPNYNSQLKTDKERLNIVKETYLKAKELGDKNVYFISGKTLFSGKDRENCTVDGIHPTDLGFYRMAKTLNKVIAPLLV